MSMVLKPLHSWLAQRDIHYSEELDRMFQGADRQAGVSDLAIKLNDANARIGKKSQPGQRGPVDKIIDKLSERNGRPTWYIMYYGKGKHKGTFFLFYGDIVDIAARLEMAIIMRK